MSKFRDPCLTATGERRARVRLSALRTLWFNTGTLCNLTCANCYIESSPTNDALVYLRAAEVSGMLDEVVSGGWPVREIGFTGGEPFMNADLCEMLEDCLGLGFSVLVLTNAMRPMRRFEHRLERLAARPGARLTLRVSLDHHSRAVHEAERGSGSWDRAIDGLCWLSRSGLRVAVAGRRLPGESEAEARRGYAMLFAFLGVEIEADDLQALVLFPEMDRAADVPEITEACWGILGKHPEAMMCATSRMVVKRRGAASPEVVACTLLPDASLGATLREAAADVALNHPHCARFCVLGGASCGG